MIKNDNDPVRQLIEKLTKEPKRFTDVFQQRFKNFIIESDLLVRLTTDCAIMNRDQNLFAMASQVFQCACKVEETLRRAENGERALTESETNEIAVFIKLSSQVSAAIVKHAFSKNPVFASIQTKHIQ